jgi:hypothetical protein
MQNLSALAPLTFEMNNSLFRMGYHVHGRLFSCMPSFYSLVLSIPRSNLYSETRNVSEQMSPTGTKSPASEKHLLHPRPSPNALHVRHLTSAILIPNLQMQ